MTQLIAPNQASATQRSAAPPSVSVAVVVGSSPELVKLGPVLARLGAGAELICTGRAEILAETGPLFLGSDQPFTALDVDLADDPVGRIVARLQTCFERRTPAVVVVIGDGQAAAGGTLAASSRGIPVVHVDAGLRANDPRQASDRQRIMLDHMADLLCVAAGTNVENLRLEGISGPRVWWTGSTMVDAIRAHLPDRSVRQWTLAQHGVRPDGYVLASIGRDEYVQDPDALGALVSELMMLCGPGMPVLVTAEPGLLEAIERGRLTEAWKCLHLIDTDFPGKLALGAHAAVLVSDLPDAPELATVLMRPLVFVGGGGQRTEAFQAFARIAQSVPEIGELVRGALANLPALQRRLINAPRPYGDGQAAGRVAAAIASVATRDLSVPIDSAPIDQTQMLLPGTRSTPTNV